MLLLGESIYSVNLQHYGRICTQKNNYELAELFVTLTFHQLNLKEKFPIPVEEIYGQQQDE
jgi:hypothetical protein